MKRSLPAVVAITALTAMLSAHAAGPTIRQLDGKKLPIGDADSLARRVLSENHVTGAAIAVLNDGQLAWISGYGERDTQLRLPMQPDTTTWAASITKSVFATYVMQLSQQGVVPLDTPIAQLLPKPLDSYAAYKDSAAELVHDPRYNAITPRMLLAHTSGLANFAAYEPDKKMHLHYAPGTRFSYSGEGINLLQLVVEQRMNMPLQQQMQTAFFTPLRMNSTALVWNPAVGSNVADRYDTDGKFIAHTRRDNARAAGSMTSSAQDLANFATALLAREKEGKGMKIARSLTGTPLNAAEDTQTFAPLLKPDTFKQMLTPVIQIDAAHQFPTFEEKKGTEGPAVGLAYGLGWGLLTRTKFGDAFFKEGHGDGAQNYMICFTRHRDCMIILTNSDNGELAFQHLLEGILGDTVTPWEWEGYTKEQVIANREKK
jgi:CubicO group peptidase (beta-lactamase class C family)